DGDGAPAARAGAGSTVGSPTSRPCALARSRRSPSAPTAVAGVVPARSWARRPLAAGGSVSRDPRAVALHRPPSVAGRRAGGAPRRGLAGRLAHQQALRDRAEQALALGRDRGGRRRARRLVGAPPARGGVLGLEEPAVGGDPQAALAREQALGPGARR